MSGCVCFVAYRLPPSDISVISLLMVVEFDGCCSCCLQLSSIPYYAGCFAFPLEILLVVMHAAVGVHDMLICLLCYFEHDCWSSRSFGYPSIGNWLRLVCWAVMLFSYCLVLLVNRQPLLLLRLRPDTFVHEHVPFGLFGCKFLYVMFILGACSFSFVRLYMLVNLTCWFSSFVTIDL
jgi:hypothetical protein